MLLLAVDKQQHPNQPDMLDQGVLCSRMEARLDRLHPLLLLDRLEEDEGLFAQVQLLEANRIEVWRCLVPSEPRSKAACKFR